MIEKTARKKPVEVRYALCRDLMQAAKHDWSALPQWLVDVYHRGGVVFTDKGIYLPTLEGSLLAGPDDLVICGVHGEVYPIKPDIFAKTYDTV